MIPRYTTVVRTLIGCAVLILTHTVHSAGFYISEVATPGSLGTAGVSNPTNTSLADSSWTNPAGMTGLQGDRILAGATLLLPKIEFDSSVAEKGGSDGGNAGNAAAIPSFFVVKNISDRVRLGFSIVALQGGQLNYGDDFVGRYNITKVSLAGVGASPSAAYKVNDRLSLGAGVSIIRTTLDQSIAINQGPLPDGKVRFDNMEDTGYQPFAGLTYHLSSDLMLGLVYRAEMDVKLKGDLNFRNLAIPTPQANKIDVDWDNPQTLKAGLRYELAEGKRLAFSAGWEDWSTFSKNQLAFKGGLLNPAVVLDRNFKDTWNAGIAFINKFSKASAYSLGFAYDSSPVDDEDRTPDLPFDESYKFSASYAWTSGKKLDFGLGGTLTYFGKGKVDQTAQGVRFKGEFDTNIALFLGATVRYIF